MENPIQVTIVMAVPLIGTLAFCATMDEKSGESAMTTSPQKIKNKMKGITGK